RVKRMNFLLTNAEFEKLKQYADGKELTMSEVIRDWIKAIPDTKG
ncbi:hypothetical protein GLO73106DRAFT_00032460, partial [Gloeocapsa sp. PCC 73106]